VLPPTSSYFQPVEPEHPIGQVCLEPTRTEQGSRNGSELPIRLRKMLRATVQGAELVCQR
jgi:hypothetical protein